MASYFLAKHVYFCGNRDSVVFLDLKNDKYVMMSGKEAADFRNLFSCTNDLGKTQTPEGCESLDTFVAAGLLTTQAANGKAILPTHFEWPSERIDDTRLSSDSRITAKRAWAFVAACILTTFRLRFLRLEQVINVIAQRKQGCAKRGNTDFARVQNLVSSFSVLRSLFPAGYLCLFDSLALVEFLARFDIYPSIVFGVSFEPWGAHCWVQADGFALNDDVETIEDYIPVMAV